jgi:hypothetical protein
VLKRGGGALLELVHEDWSWGLRLEVCEC